MILWKMVKRFFDYLTWYYDGSMDFMARYPQMKEDAIKSGEYDEWYRSRWRFAWKMIRVEWQHRDRLRCEKYGGDCSRCKAKHC